MAKYEEWLTDEGLTMLEGWARSGLIDEQIAERMGIGVRTLYEWKRKYPQISQSLKKGKEVVDYMVERALLNKALAGDTTAIIFWLKNRCPEKWRDRPEQRQEDEQESGVIVMPEVMECPVLSDDIE